MTDKDIEEIKAVVKKTIDDKLINIDAKFKEFFINREEHYQHHKFIKDLLCYTDKMKNAALKTIVSIFVTGIVGLLILGFILWGKTHLK